MCFRYSENNTTAVAWLTLCSGMHALEIDTVSRRANVSVSVEEIGLEPIPAPASGTSGYSECITSVETSKFCVLHYLQEPSCTTEYS